MAFDTTNYYQLEWIESTGTQYIDTGLSDINGYEYECKARFTNPTGAYQAIAGKTLSYRNDSMILRTNMYMYCNIANTENQIPLLLEYNKDYLFKWNSIVDTERYGSVNDTVQVISNNNNTIRTGTIPLFCIRNASDVFQYQAKLRLYYMYIKDADGYVAKFIPAQRKSDGAFGMYDSIRETFYGNSGTGVFIGFDRVNYEQLDYIESDGTSYINSGYKPNRNSIMRAKFYSPTNTGYYWGLATTESSATLYYDFAHASGKYRFREIGSSAVDVPESGSGTFYFTEPFEVENNPRVSITLTDGTTTYTRSNSANVSTQTTKNLYLMARNSDNSVYSGSREDGKRLYYLNITTYSGSPSTSNYNIVKFYLPAMRKSDGVVGLFELVTQTFYAPPSGTFSYGKKIWEANNVFIKVNGTWKQGKPFIKVNGTWQEGSPYIKVNGNWEAGV